VLHQATETGINAHLFSDDTALNGLNKSMNTIPMLNIWMPPPDMYSITACMGSCFRGEMARSHARLVFSFAYAADAAVFEERFSVRPCKLTG
jgi:hypothetical protein